MRHNGQKSAKSRFGMKAVRFVVLGIITLVVALAQTSGAVKAHDLPDYVCFPSCSAVDGRFLVINQSSSGPSFAGNKIDIELSVAASDTSFSWGVFDADATGLWDDSLAAGTAGAILRYELYADPAGDGSGTFLVDSFTADAAFLAANPGVVLDNKWYDRTINNVTYSTNPSQSAQASDSDNYHYHLRIVSTNTTTFGGASVPNGNSAFKIRTSGALGIAPQAFAYIGQLHTNVSAEVSTIYPASGGTTSGTLTPTTYDGTWEFAFFVPSGVTQINLWDGDMDYGNKDCTKPQDTDDPDTPHDYKDPLTGAFITPWTNNAAPAGASNQGVAVGSACASGTGSGNNTGAPSDVAEFESVRQHGVGEVHDRRRPEHAVRPFEDGL